MGTHFCAKSTALTEIMYNNRMWNIYGIYVATKQEKLC